MVGWGGGMVWWEGSGLSQEGIEEGKMGVDREGEWNGVEWNEMDDIRNLG